jgi:hypothetical protein
MAFPSAMDPARISIQTDRLRGALMAEVAAHNSKKPKPLRQRIAKILNHDILWLIDIK